MKFFTYLFIGLFVYLSVGLLSTPAHASWMEGEGYDQSLKDCIIGGNAAECFTKFTLTAIFNSLNIELIGISSDSINPDGTLKDEGFNRQMQQRSMAGGISRGIAMMYKNPPASAGPWIADVGHSLGFIPDAAYAQGIGFSGLAPLLPIWKVFRNIAYLILAVIMIVIGFMVMFRRKIDPKTVVTVQNALPRIVITMILITFSYAIVGFMIDLMYLFILLIVSVVGQAIPGADLAELRSAFTTGGFTQVGRIFGSLRPIALEGGIPAALSVIIALFGFIPVAAVVFLLGGLVTSALPGGGDPGSALSLFSPLLLLLLGLGLIVVMIRILFMLFNAYIQIIIALIIGPLQIMLDAVPGANGFTSWFNNLLLNILTFPVVITLIIVGTSISSLISPNFWSPPLVPKAPDSSQFIAALLGVGIIMLIPSIVNALKEALKVKPAIPAGAGVLTQPLTGAVGGVLQIGSQFFYTSQIFGMAKGMFNKEKPRG